MQKSLEKGYSATKSTTILREDYWVEVPGQDSDDTGENDRVHVEIARPESTEQDGTQLPVVVEASPYYGTFTFTEYNEVEVNLYTVDETTTTSHGHSGEWAEITADELTEFTGRQTQKASIGPSDYEERLIDEGYVWAYAASVGTEQSTGCPDTGGKLEVNGVEAVIDWLNGRADAYQSVDGDQPVDASWTNGTTGMIGASYNGTLPNAAASRGIDSLETIVPEVAISSWYDYYRMNGHVVQTNGTDISGNYSRGADTNWLQYLVVDDPEECADVRAELKANQDRTTGDYNDFWRERDYRTDIENVDASVLVTHGLRDRNVKPRNASTFIEALSENDVPYKVWFHQAGHASPLSSGIANTPQWMDLLTDWFAHWLKGEENGVMDRPTAWVQREDRNGPMETDEDWPAPSSERAAVGLEAGGEQTGGLTVGDSDQAEETLEDRSDTTPEASVLTYVNDDQNDNRLLYKSDPLEESVRLSGTPAASLELALDRKAAIVSVALVDYPPVGEPDIVNWGWADPQNRDSLTESKPIEPGTSYTLDFEMQPVDHVFDQDHRLGLVVYSTDIHFTLRPLDDDRTLTLAIGESGFELPVVGGPGKLADAFGEDLPLAVSATGDTISVEGDATIGVDGTRTSELIIDGLWDGWTVTSNATAGDFDRTGREATITYDSEQNPSIALNITPSGKYVGGTYRLDVTATNGQSSATDTATLTIE